jgi:hypothetical protein
VTSELGLLDPDGRLRRLPVQSMWTSARLPWDRQYGYGVISIQVRISSGVAVSSSAG